MNAMSNREKHEQLLKDWKEKYKKLKGDEISFTQDGPVDWVVWETQKPKILFLLKEAFDDGNPTMAKATGNFAKNILSWKYVLQKLYNDINGQINFDDVIVSEEIYREQIKEIAFVEVKKLDENNHRSSNDTINCFALQDRLFLQEQIELINPHIILCCYTIDAYDTISGGVEENTLINKEKIESCGCYPHEGRLIIDFYHPSRHPSFRMTDEQLFTLLCKIVQQGKNGSAFNEFDWGRK